MTKRFILKFFLFTSPLVLIVASYFVTDPFKVLYSYDDFYKDFFVYLNRDHVSTQSFIDRNERYQYNAFIFGSSRTMAFRTADWIKHLDSEVSPFKFDASSERLTGIWSKISFLNQRQVNLKYALLIFCPDYTFDKDQAPQTFLLARDPRVDPSYDLLSYQNIFFKSYFNDLFFIQFLDYKCFRQKRAYMSTKIEFIQLHADSVTNDLYRSDLDFRRTSNPIQYYKDADSVFYPRNGREEVLESQIDDKQVTMLKDIRQVFDKHHTRYEIVISPLYSQMKLSKADMEIILKVFGKEHVHDFSGVNDITSDKFNYYENSHYLPSVGRRIMDRIYKH